MSILYKPVGRRQYLYPRINVLTEIDGKSNISIPLVVDTEFTGCQRLGITVQMKGIHQDTGLIFDHKDLQSYAQQNNLRLRHTPIKYDFAPLDYLEVLGYDVEFQVTDGIVKTDINGDELPVALFDLYSHFALAELLMIFTGDAREKVINQILYSKVRHYKLTRRLRTYTRGKNENEEGIDAVELPFRIDLNGHKYRVRLRIIDTCAIHGIASYKNIAEATGIKLEDKDSLSQEDLEDMITTYFQKPNTFDGYSLGDLEVYEILARNAKLFENVYQDLDIPEYYQPPKLTIGSTVKNLFEAKLYKTLGIKPDDKEAIKRLEKFLGYGSSSVLKKHVHTTRCLLAKVYGGRCRNSRPTDTHASGVIVDNDIAGAYGNGLRNQIYPIGQPTIQEFKESKYNSYPTLREWLKEREYGSETDHLVPGLWTAVVSTNEIWNGDRDEKTWETLKYEQDFIASWFGFKLTEIADMKSDTETIGLEIAPKTGTVKILNNQIIQGVITSDFLDWLFNIASKRQRKELLDNLYVNAAMYYSAHSRVDNYDELLVRIKIHQGKNTTHSHRKRQTGKTYDVVTNTVEEPTYWFGLDLGKQIVDDLLAYRTMYKVVHGKKSPMDVLFKLCTNTLYGDFVSPYFLISNAVVGNNITARCRAMAWYMEKGHHAFESITDGGQIDLYKLCFPSKNHHSLKADNYTNLHRAKAGDRHIKLKPLDEIDEFELIIDPDLLKQVKTDSEDKRGICDIAKLKVWKNGESYVIDDPKEWLATKLFEHLKMLFPHISVLHQETYRLNVTWDESQKPIKTYEKQCGMFKFEIKDIYSKAIFHGASNYLLQNQLETKVAMRSYEKKKHQGFTLSEKRTSLKTEYYEGGTPAKFFLSSLENPNAVSRSKVFTKKAILKLNDWKNRYLKWSDLGFVAGDTIERSGLLREFSLSQFTYRTKEQFEAIEKEYQRNKRRYNQSYEGYFINSDGTLDYQAMIVEIDRIIASGSHSINETLDKHRHRMRDCDFSHPESEIYEMVKGQANKTVDVSSEALTDDIDWATDPEEDLGVGIQSCMEF